MCSRPILERSQSLTARSSPCGAERSARDDKVEEHASAPNPKFELWCSFARPRFRGCAPPPDPDCGCAPPLAYGGGIVCRQLSSPQVFEGNQDILGGEHQAESRIVNVDAVLSRGSGRTRPRLRRRDGHRAHGAPPRRCRFRRRGLHGCNEALVLSRPDVVARVHEAYLEAGADVLETDSFTASRLKLDEYGLGAGSRRSIAAPPARARGGRPLLNAGAAALRGRRARPDRDADLVVRPVALEDHVRRVGRRSIASRPSA